MFRDIAFDLRYAVRALRRSPGYALTVIITLTLAIGANLSVFTLARGLILASLPVPNPNQLLEIYTQNGKGEKGGLSHRPGLGFTLRVTNRAIRY